MATPSSSMTKTHVFRQSGDNDVCFYNFQCMKPLWKFKMFNNILSNVGYIILGGLFAVVVYFRENTKQWKQRMEEEERSRANTEGSSVRGIQRRHSIGHHDVEGKPDQPSMRTGVVHSLAIYYTMALALIMIGVMSACYHLCPTKVNFQFDTTYMYTLAIFMGLKLFKNRHPDISPDAIPAFTVLAYSISVGVSY